MFDTRNHPLYWQMVSIAGDRIIQELGMLRSERSAVIAIHGSCFLQHALPFYGSMWLYIALFMGDSTSRDTTTDAPPPPALCIYPRIHTYILWDLWLTLTLVWQNAVPERRAAEYRVRALEVQLARENHAVTNYLFQP